MILRGTVFSKVLEMETGITIAIPNNFDDRSAYQAVYLLHGLCGRSGDWLDYTMLPVYVNNYHIVFIMPEVARSFYTDMKYGLKYFTYITDELPLICQSVFKLSPKRENTAVIGASMGGYGALKCALTKPGQYGYCGAFASACLLLKEFLGAQLSREKIQELKARFGEQLFCDFKAAFGENLAWKPQNDILELAKSLNGQPNKPKIYCSCGTNDPFHKDHLKFCQEMKRLDFDFTYDEWQGCHDWNFFNESLQKALNLGFSLK